MNGKFSFVPNKLLIENRRAIALKSTCSKSIKTALFLGALLISTVSISQTGPAGVSANLRLWLDGSDPAFPSAVPLAGTITQWNDKSTNALVIDAPGGGATDPDYIPSEPTFNGKGVLDFDPTDVFRGNVTDWTSNHTIFIVFKQQGVPVNGTTVFSSGDTGGGGNDDRFEIQVEPTLTNFTLHTNSGATVTESVFGTTAAATAGPVMYSATRSGNNITCFQNGVQSSTMTVTNGGEFDEYVLNTNRAETIGNDCQIAEVIIYDVVLTAAEIGRINNYLACKYGLAIVGVTPGGINPCNVGLWMKADAGITLSTTDVTNWKDQSNSNINGTAASGKEPTFLPINNNFNPSMRFDTIVGGGDEISLGTAVAADGMILGSSDFTIYSVVLADPVTNGVLFSDRACVTQPGYNLKYSSATNKWRFLGGTASLSDSATVKTDNANSGFSLIRVNRAGASCTARTNYGTVTTGSSSNTINFTGAGPTERWIGKEATCGTYNFQGNLSELIVVRNTLAPIDDKKIQSYLALKYGISLNSAISDYVTSSGASVWNNMPYWNDVAGIGRDNGSLLNQRISKSQDKSGIVTIATTNNFVLANNDVTRTSLTNGSFLIWGNNNTSAATPWTVTGAPTDYAILSEVWKVRETGTVPAVHVQVDVNDADNNIPTFQGALYIVRGATIAGGTVTPMVETSTGSGIWRVSGINFADGDLFTFAVLNKLEVEFSAITAASSNEITANNFPTVIGTGTINVVTSFQVQDNGGGSASPAGVDYTYSNQTVSVPVAIYTATPFPLTPPTLVNDVLVEGLEDIQFSINAPSVSVSIGDANASGSAISNHAYTITDDDSYNISIITSQNGVEGSTAIRYKIFVVGGTNPSLVPIVGTYSWAGSTATPNTDFTAPTSFTIPVGVDTITVTINTINDGLLEGTETAIATIATSTPGVVVAGPAATANIVDDEMAGIGISIGSPVDATEGGSLQFIVSIDGGVINNSGSAINGSIGYGAGVAINTVDFGGPTSFVISPGSNSTTLSFTAIADNLVENTETVVATISGITIGATPNASTSTSTANILDEDAANLFISINSSPATVIEGPGNTIVYQVTMDAGKINGTGADITGTVLLNGTAALTADYTPNITTFAIPNGSGTGSFTVTLTNDGVVESTESLTATISVPSFGSINAANNSVTVSILDDDSGSLFVSIGSPTNATEGPASAVTFDVFIASGGPSATDITGTISYTGSASPTTDFNPVGSFTILANTNSTTITLTLINDGNTEPSETIIANLVGTPSVGAYANTNATATITDDDASSLAIYIDTVMSGAEGGANVQLVVGLEMSAINGTGGDIYGTITFSGSANSTDFTGSGNYAIPNGATYDTITLTVLDDVAVEYTDSIIAVLTSSNLGTISQSDTAIAYIYDNEFDALCISLLSPVDGDEEGPVNGSFVVAIDNGWTNELGVPLTGTLSFGGTATAGSDFSNTTTFSIPTGVSFASYSVIVIDDPSLELTETVIATITGTLEGNTCIATDTLTITDNDLANAELRITATVIDGIELPSPTNPEFTVSITGGLINETGTDITGTITFAGTALEGTDYDGVFDFTIPNNSGTDVLVMQVSDDLLEEPTETIIATISTATVIAIGSVNTATANILDDDTDNDHDGLSDLYDPNPNNIDSDCDGIYDGCDYDPYGNGTYFNGTDTDGDGINDACDADTNNDGIVDNGPDIDGDGLNDVVWDPTDDDGDFLPNHVDPDPTNEDTDGDGTTDGADVDADGDGINDHGCDDDNDQVHNQADKDYIDNASNPDDDNDGIINSWDMTPVNLDGQSINYIVSPNNDNVNETLRIPGIQVFPDHQLIIYNRWGTQIFSSVDYKNDWAGEIQGGIVVGNPEESIEGTYFYTLDLGNGKDYVRGYIEIRK